MYVMRSASPGTKRALRYAGDRVRSDRVGRAWSQRELERRSGVDQTTISRLERGLAPGLRLEAFASILLALGSLGSDASEGTTAWVRGGIYRPTRPEW